MPPKKQLKYDEPIDDQETDSNQQLIEIQQKSLEVLLANQQQLRRLTKSVAIIKTDVAELKRARGIRNNNILPIMGLKQMKEIQENFHLYEEDLRMIFNDYAAGTGLEFCRHFCNELFDHVDHYNWTGRPAPNSGTPEKMPGKASALKIVGLLVSVVTAKFNTDARSGRKFMIDALKAHYDARMKALAAARAREAQAKAAQDSGAVVNEQQ